MAMPLYFSPTVASVACLARAHKSPHMRVGGASRAERDDQSEGVLRQPAACPLVAAKVLPQCIESLAQSILQRPTATCIGSYHPTKGLSLSNLLEWLVPICDVEAQERRFPFGEAKRLGEVRVYLACLSLGLRGCSAWKEDRLDAPRQVVDPGTAIHHRLGVWVVVPLQHRPEVLWAPGVPIAPPISRNIGIGVAPLVAESRLTTGHARRRQAWWVANLSSGAAIPAKSAEDGCKLRAQDEPTHISE
mmetsp:Transcript_64209/g.143497  ORF Transcript_64209/g.143497 Transcript_64209/m.143497 type:complete len:247 (-) Transcript_64209:71-811(-)